MREDGIMIMLHLINLQIPNLACLVAYELKQCSFDGN